MYEEATRNASNFGTLGIYSTFAEIGDMNFKYCKLKAEILSDLYKFIESEKEFLNFTFYIDDESIRPILYRLSAELVYADLDVQVEDGAEIEMVLMDAQKTKIKCFTISIAHPEYDFVDTEEESDYDGEK